jgi:cytosine/adenosine deaminase-related metal-dependent hydrolase
MAKERGAPPLRSERRAARQRRGARTDSAAMMAAAIFALQDAPEIANMAAATPQPSGTTDAPQQLHADEEEEEVQEALEHYGRAQAEALRQKLKREHGLHLSLRGLGLCLCHLYEADTEAKRFDERAIIAV